MKYKWLFVLAAAVMLTAAYAATDVEPAHNRYHQHLEAAEKPPCTDHGGDLFCTHLPLMEITTDEPVPEPYIYRVDNPDLDTWRVQNNEMVGATVRYFDSETENNHLTDTPVVEERAMFRIRGRSSRSFDKKNYLLKFTKEDMASGLNISLSGMTADNSWVLHGPFLDKSLIRNYICYNLMGEFMDYSPDVRFCELFLNGEYMGLYLLAEKIGYSPRGRINLTETNPDLTATSYIVRVDRPTTDLAYDLETFGTYSYMIRGSAGSQYGHYKIIYPSATLTPEQYDYIEMDMSRFEKALFSFDYNDPDRGYLRYIDVESFVDVFLITEFTLNYDSPSRSTYLYKDVGGKLKLAAWDFNSAFDYYEYSNVSPETFQTYNTMWFRSLFRDKDFVDRVVERYYYLRGKFFNEEYLFPYIDETVAYLGPAIERNFQKWGYSFNSVYNGVDYDFLEPENRNVRSHEQAIQQIKDCISQRIDHMDSNLGRLYILCHESMNKRYNHMTEGNGQ